MTKYDCYIKLKANDITIDPVRDESAELSVGLSPNSAAKIHFF